MKYAIEIINLTKTYGKHRGVESVDLSVKEGEWFGFIGPNGAGKSTTIRTLLGLIKPTRGETKINGMDSWLMKDKIMKDVGYLPSEAIFYPEMTVKETLDYALSFFGNKDVRRQKELCRRFQLDTKRKVGELSYGNRKKVGIVSALQHSPSLLILDEPTGGLDPLMQREFFNLLEEEHKNGKTIFMSSHILSEIEHHAQTAAFIRDGKIILKKEVSELSKTSRRKVSLRGSLDISGLQGVKEVVENKDGISFLYSGDSKVLLDVLSKGDIKDFTVTEPDLEEVFLHYYKREDK